MDEIAKFLQTSDEQLIVELKCMGDEFQASIVDDVGNHLFDAFSKTLTDAVNALEQQAHDWLCNFRLD